MRISAIRLEVAIVTGSNEKLLLNVQEASRLIGVAETTLYHWVSEGRIPVVKLSRRCIRFRVSDLETWIASMSEPARSGTQRVRNKSLALLPG